jgi:hypothetical protein
MCSKRLFKSSAGRQLLLSILRCLLLRSILCLSFSCDQFGIDSSRLVLLFWGFFEREQMKNLGIKPYTVYLKERRATMLAKNFPQYDAAILNEFVETDPMVQIG